MLISSCWNIDIRLFSFYRKIRFGPDQSHYNQSRRWSWLQTTIAQNTRIAPSEYILHWKFFHSSRFLTTCAYPENRVVLEFFTVLNILFTFRIFEQLALALKTEFALEIFHCIEYTFYIQDFWATWACPEKQSCPGIFHCIECIFYHSGFLSNQRLPWNFSNPGGGRPPPGPSYALVRPAVKRVETSKM